MRIQVPGTSANLGPGFDALGLALGVHDRFGVEILGEGLPSLITGCPPEHAGEDNLFLVAFHRGLEAQGLGSRSGAKVGVRLHIEADIPIARGLGSSAACLVGGLLAAATWGARQGRGLSRDEILGLACGLEGHPDNVAPALLGGFRASAAIGPKVTTVGRELGPGLAFHALIPPFALETRKARAALPSAVPFENAVFNVGRAALVTAAIMAADWAALGAAVDDRLHQPFRAPLVPGLERVLAEASSLGALGAYLSGAGPTIMVLGRAPDDGLAERLGRLSRELGPEPWRCVTLGPDNTGAIVLEE